MADQLNAERLANKSAADASIRRQRDEHSEAARLLEEKLKNTQIDLDASNEKLTESLKDYKNSIAKFKAASSQRYQKMKKKFASAVSVLNQIHSELLDSTGSADNLFGAFLAAMNTQEKKRNEHEASPGPDTADDQPAAEFEFDEQKFREFFKVCSSSSSSSSVSCGTWMMCECSS